MKFLLKLSTLAGFCLMFSAPAQATTIPLDIKLDFDLVKTTHNCTDVTGGGGNPGPGNCGFYQALNLGQTYTGTLNLTILPATSGRGTAFGEIRGTSCFFGPITCFGRGEDLFGPAMQAAKVSEQSIDFQPTLDSFNSSFFFDLMAGTGWHMWQDDAPIESDGIFHFSNVVVSGFPPAVPLPASLAFLLAGLGTFGVAKRSWRL